MKREKAAEMEERLGKTIRHVRRDDNEPDKNRGVMRAGQGSEGDAYRHKAAPRLPKTLEVTPGHSQTRQDTPRHSKTRQDTSRHEKRRQDTARSVKRRPDK